MQWEHLFNAGVPKFQSNPMLSLLSKVRFIYPCQLGHKTQLVAAEKLLSPSNLFA